MIGRYARACVFGSFRQILLIVLVAGADHGYSQSPSAGINHGTPLDDYIPCALTTAQENDLRDPKGAAELGEDRAKKLMQLIKSPAVTSDIQGKFNLDEQKLA